MLFTLVKEKAEGRYVRYVRSWRTYYVHNPVKQKELEGRIHLFYFVEWTVAQFYNWKISQLQLKGKKMVVVVVCVCAVLGRRFSVCCGLHNNDKIKTAQVKCKHTKSNALGAPNEESSNLVWKMREDIISREEHKLSFEGGKDFTIRKKRGGVVGWVFWHSG